MTIMQDGFYKTSDGKRRIRCNPLRNPMSLWVNFNKYASLKGYTEMITGEYLGSVAWKNPATGEVLELKAEID